MHVKLKFLFITILAKSFLFFGSALSEEYQDLQPEDFDAARFDLEKTFHKRYENRNFSQNQDDVREAVAQLYRDFHPKLNDDFWRRNECSERLKTRLIYASFVARAYEIATILNEAEEIFRHIQKCGAVSVEDIETLHTVYITMRRFDAATALRQAYPEAALEPPPSVLTTGVLKPGHRPLLTANMTGDAFLTTSLNFADFSGLLFVIHPQCGFCRMALRAIDEDAALKTRMVENALWLASSYTQFDTKLASAFPDAAIHVARHDADWPEIIGWGTPSFYFIKDGRLVSYFSGWPRGEEAERLERLRKGFDEVLDKP